MTFPFRRLIRWSRGQLLVLLCGALVIIAGSASPAVAEIPEPPGGPILLITNPADKYSDYYQEILLNEGLNSFAVSPIGDVTAAKLNSHDIAILAAMPLSAAQVTLLSNWVSGGGRLIAMRPDKQLATLLGLTDANATLSQGYLLIDTSKAPGNGLVGETIQFHGTADRYTLNGAERLATLYTTASTPTSNPALTWRAVGGNGGQAAAFTYDLARSIVYTRQGNPAWESEERDGFTPIRSNDKFYGAAQSDWIDLNKVAIPQADEQQRLLVNLILRMNLSNKPLPRFWYFPRGKKAVVLMTGDDHGNNGTEERFNRFRQLSPAGCSVANWECVRGTSYVYPGTPLSSAQAAAFNADGFEISLHLSTNCGDFTPASLRSFYATQLQQFAAQYQGAPTPIPAPITQRHHCIAWSDWVTGAEVQLENGIRLDTSYYYWPPGWVQNRPGFFNGSGMPMRFAKLDGDRIDVFLTETQMTDESGQTYPFTIDRLLDRALGADGYYGVFTVNAHTDFNFGGTYPESEAVVGSALARDVPVITARQLLAWLDGRNASSFAALSMTGETLTFSIQPAGAAVGLQALLPTISAAGVLTTITRNGTPVSFTRQTIKGVEYAVLPAAAGSYAATYAGDTTPPTVMSAAPANGGGDVALSARVSAVFSESIDPQTLNASTVQLRDPSGTAVSGSVSYDSNSSTVQLTPSAALAVSTTYTGFLKGGASGVKDLFGNALANDYTWSFTTTSTALCAPQQPCRIWPTSPSPASPSVADPNAVELGVKFRSDVAGFISGIRFYKGAGNTGTHVGSLWTAGGSLLARATFSNETTTGWQQVTFATPVPVSAGTVYIASYHAPNGNYAGDNGYFAANGVTSEPLYALRDGESGGNGVYTYASTPTFPSTTYQSSNYWVDVTFVTSAGSGTPPPTVTATVPAAGATGVALGAVVTATFSDAMDPATITASTVRLQGAAAVPASVSYDAPTRTATLTPTDPLAAATTYTATVVGGTSGVKSAGGVALASNATWSFSTVAADTTPPTVTARTPLDGAIDVPRTTTVTATFSEAMAAATINTSTIELRNPTNALIAATVGYNATTRTATLTPSAQLAAATTYTATVIGGTNGVTDAAGNALAANAVWSFTTAADSSAGCPCTIWPPSATPGVIEDPETASVELGVKFRSNTDGFITGLRFYKGVNNTGTHVGTLWSATGQPLAQATFTSETASGWQQVNFAVPVAINADTVYVASYHTSVGRYSADDNYFTAAVTNGPLTALRNGEAGGNGVYTYSATPAFPSSTFQASNYWVDVVFVTSTGPDTTPPTVTARSPVAGAGNVFTGTAVTATFSEPVAPATVTGSTFTLRQGTTPVPASVSYDAPSRTATLDPSSSLAAATTYTASLTGAIEDLAGNALAATSWSFTTAAAPNSIAEENALPGTPKTVWDISGAGDPSIQGFATDISYNRGEIVDFKIDAAAAYDLTIYRLGYYGGDGARLIDDTISNLSPVNQPGCTGPNGTTGLVDCGNWTVSASWQIPANAVSGIYIARPTRRDTGGASHIVFIVRNDASQSDILFQTADTTWQAYNAYGNRSLYTGAPGTSPNRAYKVSYNRPFTTRQDVTEGHDWLMYAEYPMVRWLERNGYDVSYTTGIDTHRRGALIRNHKVFLSVGHDEYWSAEQRANVEAARAAGVHLGFFSGNALYWKTRWEPATTAGSPSAATCQASPLTEGCHRTLVSYKESHNYPPRLDPTGEWTGLWRDSRAPAGSGGNNPENALMGTIFTVNETNEVSLRVPAEYAALRFWRNAGLPAGQTAVLGQQIIGYEFDEDLDNGRRPAGLMRLSETFYPNAPRIQDETGSNYGPANVFHHLTLYRAASGALVFGAGTIQWAWGLDSVHDGPQGLAPSPAMQQATVNLFADMGAQPQTLQGGLVAATASTDSTRPTTTITAPTDGASVAPGVQLTIRGTAADSGGGVVAAVEVSVDGGSTWRPATGRADWSYDWTPGTTPGSVSLSSRAVDDSGNLQSPTTSITVSIGSTDTTPPTVMATVPETGTTGIAVNSAVTVTFSEAMTAATINSSTILLQQGATTVPASVGYNATTRTATLTPTAALAAGTVYTGTVRGGTAGVKDLAGNPLAADYGWSFTTAVAGPVTAPFNSIASQDGYVRESGETTNVGGSVFPTSTGTRALRIGDDASDRQYKTIVSFDTSTLPDNAIILSATLRLRRGAVTGGNPFAALGTCSVDIATPNGFGDNLALAASDFSVAATASQVATMSNPPANNDWSEGTLNATGLNALNKTGVTQFRIAFQLDDDDDRSNDEMGFYAGEAAAASRPQLLVTYELP